MSRQPHLPGSAQIIVRFLQRNPILVGIVGLAIVTTFVEPQFLSTGNANAILRQFGTLIFVSLGMTFVIMAGFLDLSVGGIISLVAVVVAANITSIGQGPAILLGLCVGVACGLVNSALILKAGAKTQAESLFITYGMTLVFTALAFMYVQGITQYLYTFTREQISLFNAINAGTLPVVAIPLSFCLFVVCAGALYFVERRTYMGRAVLLTGANKTAARLAGIRVDLSIVVIYAVSGLLSAVAAIVLISQVKLASPATGAPYMLQAILAVVVGGTALIGGRGSILWTVLGALMLIVLNNCLDLLGLPTPLQYATRGAVLILAIWIDSRRTDTGAVAIARAGAPTGVEPAMVEG